MARESFDERHYARRERQLVFNHLEVRFALALDDGLHGFVVEHFACTLEGCADESPVVHAEHRHVLINRERNAFGSQDLLIGFEVQRFVIDNDAVEIKEDGLNHVAASGSNAVRSYAERTSDCKPRARLRANPTGE